VGTPIHLSREDHVNTHPLLWRGVWGQHASTCECEQMRMVNLVHVRGMPVRWIRYNPDVYEPAVGCRKVKQEQREKKLVEYTKWAIKHAPVAMSDVLYLFYDGYDTQSQEWHTLI